MIDGEAEIIVNGHDSAEVVGEEEFLGELALLNESLHGASVRARGIVNTAVIEHDDLNDLIRNRGDIGFTIYRNLAAGLSAKLKRSTSSVG